MKPQNTWNGVHDLQLDVPKRFRWTQILMPNRWLRLAIPRLRLGETVTWPWSGMHSSIGTPVHHQLLTSLSLALSEMVVVFEEHALQISFWNMSCLTITVAQLTAPDEHSHSASPHLHCSHLSTSVRWETSYPHQTRCIMPHYSV